MAHVLAKHDNGKHTECAKLACLVVVLVGVVGDDFHRHRQPTHRRGSKRSSHSFSVLPTHIRLV